MAMTVNQTVLQAMIDHPGSTWRIEYVDAQLNPSVRTVRVIRAYRGRSGARQIVAFCHLKGAERTFRADRIAAAERIVAVGSSAGAERSAAAGQLPRGPSESRPTRKRHFVRTAFVCAGAALVIRILVHAAMSAGAAPATVTESRLQAAAARTPSAASRSAAGARSTASTSTGGVRPAPPSRSASSAPVVRAVQTAHRSVTAQNAPTVIERVDYRGIAIDAVITAAGERFAIPEYGAAAATLRGAYLIVNDRLFEQETHVESRTVETIYAAADTDGNGRLSWQEIEAFQRIIFRTFRYQANDTALRPDQFVEQGGGDCEDWAIFTAGLLEYWGWNAEIATIDPPDGGTGHAVAFVRVPAPILGLGTYPVATTDPGTGASTTALYVPIDYFDVGGFTNAVGPGWKLTGIYRPESLYGRYM
jgi:hypothetical protein